MKTEHVIVETSDEVSTIKFAEPDKLNLLRVETIKELEDCLEEAVRHNPHVIIITGGNGKVFSAGADIKEMRQMNRYQALEYAKIGQRIIERIERAPIIVIAAIDGICVGGGMELIQACDFRIATRRSVFGQPEINIGISTGWGASQRLPRIVGLSKAKELILTGKRITAEEALKIGFLYRVVPPEKLNETVNELTSELKKKSRATLAAAKLTLNLTTQLPLKYGLQTETLLWSALFETHDQKEGMTAFLEHRDPNFKDSNEEYLKAIILQPNPAYSDYITDFLQRKHEQFVNTILNNYFEMYRKNINFTFTVFETLVNAYIQNLKGER